MYTCFDLLLPPLQSSVLKRRMPGFAHNFELWKPTCNSKAAGGSHLVNPTAPLNSAILP